MKIRTGFVSNSSSSSFIVISAGKYEKENSLLGKEWKDFTKLGNTDFGWEETIYYDVYSKVNFAYLQALHVNNKQWLKMIDEVICEHTGATSAQHEFTVEKRFYFRQKDDQFEYNDITGGYIDHQSCSTEGSNTEMFESKEILKDFLFGSESYIQGGNDN